MAADHPNPPWLHVDGVRLPTPGAWVQVLAIEGAPGSSRILMYLGYWYWDTWYIYMVEVSSAYISYEGEGDDSFG